MPQELKEVVPGQIISADWMNALLERVQALETAIKKLGDKVTVPDAVGQEFVRGEELVGKYFENILAYDVNGKEVSAGARAKARIINQVPPPGVEVAPGTKMYFIVASG